MGSFVNPNETVEIAEFDPEVVIADVTPRVIVIRAKMDYATSRQVQGAVMRGGLDGSPAELNLGDSLMELLIQNIVAWRGGDLDGVPCDAAHIRMLDPTDPFVDRVADEIGTRNKKATDQKNGTSAGGPSSVVPASSTTESGTPNSRSLTPTTGRRNR